jgi:hypothetical protein
MGLNLYKAGILFPARWYQNYTPYQDFLLRPAANAISTFGELFISHVYCHSMNHLYLFSTDIH